MNQGRTRHGGSRRAVELLVVDLSLIGRQVDLDWCPRRHAVAVNLDLLFDCTTEK